MQYVVKRDDETIDEIVYKNYGSSFGYLELVMKSNIFLYEEDIYLQKDTIINLPEVKKESKTRASLWN